MNLDGATSADFLRTLWDEQGSAFAPTEVGIACLAALGDRDVIAKYVVHENDSNHTTWRVLAITPDELVVVTGKSSASLWTRSDEVDDADVEATFLGRKDIAKLSITKASEVGRFSNDFNIIAKWRVQLRDGSIFDLPSISDAINVRAQLESFMSALRLFKAGAAVPAPTSPSGPEP